MSDGCVGLSKCANLFRAQTKSLLFHVNGNLFAAAISHFWKCSPCTIIENMHACRCYFCKNALEYCVGHILWTMFWMKNTSTVCRIDMKQKRKDWQKKLHVGNSMQWIYCAIFSLGWHSFHAYTSYTRKRKAICRDSALQRGRKKNTNETLSWHQITSRTRHSNYVTPNRIAQKKNVCSVWCLPTKQLSNVVHFQRNFIFNS